MARQAAVRSITRPASHLCLFPLLLHYYSRSKGPHSELRRETASQHLSLQNSITVFPLYFSVSFSFIQNLEKAFLIFYNNILAIINLSLCSFHTVLGVIVPGAGREDGYKWHQSQAFSSLGLPSDKPRLEESNAAALSVVGIYNQCLLFF